MTDSENVAWPPYVHCGPSHHRPGQARPAPALCLACAHVVPPLGPGPRRGSSSGATAPVHTWRGASTHRLQAQQTEDRTEHRMLLLSHFLCSIEKITYQEGTGKHIRVKTLDLSRRFYQLTCKTVRIQEIISLLKVHDCPWKHYISVFQDWISESFKVSS